MKEQERRERYEKWIEQHLAWQFDRRVLPFDGRAAAIWGRLIGDGDRFGRRPVAADARIAAVAIQYELMLVTRNVRDFAQFDVDLLNPWGADANSWIGISAITERAGTIRSPGVVSRSVPLHPLHSRPSAVAKCETRVKCASKERRWAYRDNPNFRPYDTGP